MMADLEKTREAMQAQEDRMAKEQGRKARKIAISSKVRGIMVEKDFEYSIDGMRCKCTLSPGLVDGIPLANDDIGGSTMNFTQIIEAEG